MYYNQSAYSAEELVCDKRLTGTVFYDEVKSILYSK